MKGISFNTEMVRAILSGAKTQTRTPIIPQPVRHQEDCSKWIYADCELRRGGFVFQGSELSKHCPFSVGEIIYARELVRTFNSPVIIEGGHFIYPEDYIHGWNYYADDLHLITDKCFRYEYHRDRDDIGYGPWISTKEMPQQAARIFLRINNIRAERIKSMSRTEISSEGLKVSLLTFEEQFDAVTLFGETWDAIYKDKGFSWDSNPWVWVYEFERMGSK